MALTEREIAYRKVLSERQRLKWSSSAGNPNGNANPSRCVPRCNRKFRTGRTCQRTTLKDSKYCIRHCGAGIVTYRKNKANGFKKMNLATVADIRPRDQQRVRFYGKVLGPHLEAFVNECLESPESEQLSLLEELAVMRGFAGEALQLHAMAIALPETNKLRQQHIANASALALQALENVRIMAKTASDNFIASKDKFSVHSLLDVVAQLKRIAYAAFEHDTEALNRFDSLIAAQLRLPKIGAEGTDITPDADVIEMDSTIPLVNE